MKSENVCPGNSSRSEEQSRDRMLAACVDNVQEDVEYWRSE